MNKKKKGFTLTELIVVMAVIAILAAVLIPSITGYIKKAKQSNQDQEATAVYQIMDAWFVEMYANDTYMDLDGIKNGDKLIDAVDNKVSEEEILAGFKEYYQIVTGSELGTDVSITLKKDTKKVIIDMDGTTGKLKPAEFKMGNAMLALYVGE